MYDFETYHRAESIAHAVSLLTDNPQARLLAGGTDVLIQLHHLNERFRHIVDIHDLPELRGISCDEAGHIRIGSATTFSELIDSPVINQCLPALSEAAATIAGPQIRNVATYGGNICNGATSGDSACPSLIYQAELEIATPDGIRRRPLRGFHTGPGKVAFEPGELLIAFHFSPENYRNKALPLTNMPCAARWISPPLTARRCVISEKDVLRNCALLSALRHRRRSAVNTRKRPRSGNRSPQTP